MSNQEEDPKPLDFKARSPKPIFPDDSTTGGSSTRSKSITLETSSRKRTRTIPNKPTPRSRTPPLSDTAMARPRNVEKLVYGKYEIDAWYYSPYPNEFGSLINRLYVCDTCLKYMKDDGQLSYHKLHCRKRVPPGTVVYADDKIKIYEVDGRDHKMYCQNLCLMAKLFLDHKTLYYDVDGFKFYVLTEREQKTKDLVVGYFSKEKVSYDNYNLACIMTLPSHQRKGYGRLLIEWSYELSKREGIIGSPEKPLSTLGLYGYHSYWRSLILQVLHSLPKSSQITIASICQETRLQEDDVISTLTKLGLLRYWDHSSSSSSSSSTFTSSSSPSHLNPDNLLAYYKPPPPPVVIHIEPNTIQNIISKNNIHFTRQLNPDCILLPPH